MCDDGDERTYFIYIGRGGLDIPRDVTHVRVHPSVKGIKDEAFSHCCPMLTHVDLGDGFEEIGERAFEECIHHRRIAIPPSVKMIRDEAFLCLPAVDACESRRGSSEEIGSSPSGNRT